MNFFNWYSLRSLLKVFFASFLSYFNLYREASLINCLLELKQIPIGSNPCALWLPSCNTCLLYFFLSSNKDIASRTLASDRCWSLKFGTNSHITLSESAVLESIPSYFFAFSPVTAAKSILPSSNSLILSSLLIPKYIFTRSIFVFFAI